MQAQTMDSLLYGTVSYQNPNNVYVKFSSTAMISSGDTLFVQRDQKLIPALIVKHISSISVVGEPLVGLVETPGSNLKLTMTDVIVFKSKSIRSEVPDITTPPVHQDDHVVEPAVPISEETQEVESMEETHIRKEQIRGRLSASFYSNVFNAPVDNIQRMRYTFSLQAKNIDNSRISAETYVSFRHQLEDWNAEKVEMSKALRVYNLAVSYDAGERTVFALGRKVNPHISNVGAIDGLQVAHNAGRFTFGGFAGTRPDHTDYGFNADLLQFGGFIAHKAESKQGPMTNSFAIVEQRNAGMTDRRFAYLQHSSSLVKNISLFTSFEVDLYARPDSVAENTFSITGAYVSLQFRPSRKFTFFGSYDARKNVIYYETYRNFIDELIEQETRQGLRFRANYRPMKYVTIGSSVGYRFQQAQGSNSMNMYHYISHSRIPWINTSGTISLTTISNDYLSGFVYGIRLSHDLIKQIVYGEIEYRNVDYKYGSSEFSLKQHIAGVNISWRVMKKLTLAVDYEGIVETERTHHRVHLNVSQRF